MVPRWLIVQSSGFRRPGNDRPCCLPVPGRVLRGSGWFRSDPEAIAFIRGTEGTLALRRVQQSRQRFCGDRAAALPPIHCKVISMEQTATGAPLVEMRGIRKSFPGVQASDGVDLRLERGEVLALLGENGAGKSTLMNILSGLYRQDSGDIFIAGRKVDIRSPKDASALGVGMVHQNFMLVDTMTVAENVVLGMPSLPFLPDMAQVKKAILDLGERYNMKVDPDAYIWQLSVGEQQRVEILKQLYRNAEILVLDEPTAVLTPQESQELNVVVGRMRDEGKSAIFITHKMDEVIAFSNRVMVLRKGKVVAEKMTAETDPKDLARMMVGREILFRIEKSPFQPGAAVLELRDVCADDERGLPALRDLSLVVRSGEIVGIAGVAGTGQREL